MSNLPDNSLPPSPLKAQPPAPKPRMAWVPVFVDMVEDRVRNRGITVLAVLLMFTMAVYSGTSRTPRAHLLLIRCFATACMGRGDKLLRVCYLFLLNPHHEDKQRQHKNEASLEALRAEGLGDWGYGVQHLTHNFPLSFQLLFTRNKQTEKQQSHWCFPPAAATRSNGARQRTRDRLPRVLCRATSAIAASGGAGGEEHQAHR